MFRHWRHYLHQAMHTVKVHTDHANLLYWKNPGDHNRRVVCWHAELMEYNFELAHISGKKNGQANTLSRCPDYDQGDNDNKGLVVLPPKFFTKAYATIIMDKKEERTPLSNDKRKLQKEHTSSARVAGSEEADANNGPEWRHYLAGIDAVNYNSLQKKV